MFGGAIEWQAILRIFLMYLGQFISPPLVFLDGGLLKSERLKCCRDVHKAEIGERVHNGYSYLSYSIVP